MIQKKIWSLINNVLEFIFGLGLVVVITHIYSPEETGLWFLFISIFALASSLRDAFIQSALVKSSTAQLENEWGDLKTNLFSMLAFEVIAEAIIVCIGMVISNGPLAILLIYYPIYALINAIYRWHLYYLRSRLRIKEVTLTSMVNLIVTSIGMFLVYYFSYPLQWIIVALGGGSIAAVLFSLVHLPYSQILRSNVSTRAFGIIFRLGSYGMLREAVSAISSRVSLFYAHALIGLQSTALLGVSQRFAQVALLPNTSFQSILFPELMKDINEGNTTRAARRFEKSLAQLLAFTLPFMAIGIVLSPWLLEWMSGNSYRSSWPILVTYLVIATLITPFGTAFGSMVTALGKPAIAFRVVLVNSILNISLGYAAMKWMGLAGAPFSMALVELMGFLWISKILNKHAGIQFKSVFAQVISFYKNINTELLQLIKMTRAFAHNR